MTTERRAPLTRERVLASAISLADEGGIESVTMRKLGGALGVEAMSLYNHVARKDDILDGILDVVVDEIALPSGQDWKPALRASAISAHEVLLRHPWACNLMMSPARVRPARLRYMEALLGRLRQAGLSSHKTHLAYHALDSHILGHTMWEVGNTTGIRALGDFVPTFVQQLSADEFPHLFEHMGEHQAPTEEDEGEFEFGLDLILDGLERIVEADAWWGSPGSGEDSPSDR